MVEFVFTGASVDESSTQSTKYFCLFSTTIYDSHVADTTPIPVRLSQPIIDRLDKVAATMGNSRGGVIKFCVSSFLDHFERNGGQTSLPPNWREILKQSDGRTHRYELKESAKPKMSAAALGEAMREKSVHPLNAELSERSTKAASPSDNKSVRRPRVSRRPSNQPNVPTPVPAGRARE